MPTPVSLTQTPRTSEMALDQKMTALDFQPCCGGGSFRAISISNESPEVVTESQIGLCIAISLCDTRPTRAR